jgi:peptidoglycan hydrolase CwlO-like protein
MSDASKDIILEYKDQVRQLREEVAELQDSGKTKDAANKRCLQKLENTNEDLSRATKEIEELKEKLKETK